MGRTDRKDAQASGASGVAARNFSLPTEERVRAIAAGPPAHLRRLRAIEDLAEGIVRVLAQRYDEARALAVDPDAYARSRVPARALERLADLIARHNRWYPVEANLPMHPRTGELVDRSGMPWRPLPGPDVEQLLAQAKALSSHNVSGGP
jgi:hypothetical protein